MPVFTSLAEADAWRAVHAPARKSTESSEKKGVEVAEKNAPVSGTTTESTAKTTGTGSSGKDDGDNFKLSDDPSRDPSAAKARAEAARALEFNRNAPPPERVNVDEFVDKQADFDALMIKQAEELPQIAFGLLKRKTAAGEPGAISAATKNWHEASKAAADVRERFIATQRETRALISIDDVEGVVAPELQEIRKRLKYLGARLAPVIAPEDAERVQKIIDAGVDKALAPGELLVERVKAELATVEEEASVT